MEQAVEFASWVEVDLDAIAGNVAAVKGLLEPGVRLLAVVKADGYGHGLVPAARVAVARGAEMLGVTHPGDGAALRQAGITAPGAGLSAAAAGRGGDSRPVRPDSLGRFPAPGRASVRCSRPDVGGRRWRT